MPQLGETFQIIGTVVEQKIEGETGKKRTVLKIEESDGNAFYWSAFGTADWKGIAISETYLFNVDMKDNPKGKYPWRNLLKPAPVPAEMPPSGEMTSRLGDTPPASSPARNGSNGGGDDPAVVARIIAFGRMRNRREALKSAIEIAPRDLDNQISPLQVLGIADMFLPWIEQPLQDITQDAQTPPEATPNAPSGTSPQPASSPAGNSTFGSTEFWTWFKKTDKTDEDIDIVLGTNPKGWIDAHSESWLAAAHKLAEAWGIGRPVV